MWYPSASLGIFPPIIPGSCSPPGSSCTWFLWILWSCLLYKVVSLSQAKIGSCAVSLAPGIERRVPQCLRNSTKPKWWETLFLGWYRSVEASAPASVCACTPPLPGKSYKTASSKASSSWPSPLPSPTLLLFTGLCSAPDFHLDTQKADEAIVQCIKLKCSCGWNASLLFKNHLHLHSFSLCRKERSPVSQYFLYCLVLGDGLCVCVCRLQFLRYESFLIWRKEESWWEGFW